MIDYEDLILARQEERDLWEDGCVDVDECSSCKFLSECRKAGEGKGEFPICPHQGKGEDMYD